MSRDSQLLHTAIHSLTAHLEAHNEQIALEAARQSGELQAKRTAPPAAPHVPPAPELPAYVAAAVDHPGEPQ